MGRHKEWTEEQDNCLRELYLKMDASKIGEILGKTASAVRGRCHVLGISGKHTLVSENDREKIRTWYTNRNNKTGDGSSLIDLCESINKSVSCVAGIAKEMGLTRLGRDYSEATRQKISESQKKRISIKGHPRHMLGKHHSEEWKKAHSIRLKARVFTEDQTRERVRKLKETRNNRYGAPEKEKEISIKRAKTNILRYGTTAPHMRDTSHAYRYVRAGKRSDLGDFYFRSSWEANYARYLNLFVSQGRISSWEYECKTFVFDKTTTGISSYTPDFKVYFLDGHYEWHEVKGWINERSQKTFQCMNACYPNEVLLLIGPDEYNLISKQKASIDNWE